jgi:putative ABC transport system permease protein
MTNFWFEFKEGLFIALRAIRSNKVRSILTMLGIVIGITSVVLMTTAISGIDNAFQQGISALGSDVLYVSKWPWFGNEDWWKIRNRRSITMEDYEKFKELAKLPVAVAPVVNSLRTVKNGSISVDNVIMTGSDADYVETTNFTFDQGRFFTETESKSSRNVVVLGSDIANTLFPRGDAIDKEIKIGNEIFRVVGVLTKQGSFILGSFNPDNQVYVPIGTIFKYFSSRWSSSITINVRANGPAMVSKTKDEAEGVMRKVRGLRFDEDDDFAINQQEALQQSFNSIVGVIQIAGLFITGLALFVGAIGIMNIMFVSVRERTKEIGLRKAIGAKRRTILAQFIMESSAICLMGGLVGLLLAIILSIVVNQFLPTSVSYSAVLIAIFVSLVTGILAGFAPAYTAAKMDPVEALRFE